MSVPLPIPTPTSASIPITVIGGYLGAGKTTLLNALLANSTSRIGVIVNDFGDVGIDAQLVREASEGAGGDVPVVNLANGCVCCTLGDGLQSTLATLASLDPPLDHVVIEASGVADPAAAAAWGTVPPFMPGGVVVLAAATSIRQQVVDRYVGAEVQRQLSGADIIVLTKGDALPVEQLSTVSEWLATCSAAPVVRADFGDVPADVLLGARGNQLPLRGDGHASELARYTRWQWAFDQPVERAALDRFLEELPEGVLRLKGLVSLSDPGAGWVVVQVVGHTVSITQRGAAPAPNQSSVLTAIGVEGVFESAELDALARCHLLGS